MRETIHAERTMRDAERRPDRASAEAARGCVHFRQEPDTRTGVSTSDTPAMHQSYSIQPDLATPPSILPRGIGRTSGTAAMSPSTRRTAELASGASPSAPTMVANASLMGAPVTRGADRAKIRR